MSKKHVREPKKKQAVGKFFQVGLAMALHLAENCSLNALIAYIVLCWGVDNSHKAADYRLCRHGANSLRLNSDMSERAAAAAIRELIQAEAIELREGAEIVGPPFRLPYGEHSDLVAISNVFIGGHESPLVDLCRRVHDPLGDVDVPRDIAVKDALVLFLSLHAHMDFAEFGGVDPRVLHAKLEIQGEIGPWGAGQPLGWHQNHRVVTVVAAGDQAFDHMFVSEILSRIPVPDECRAVTYQRAELAYTALRSLGFVYTAYVLYGRDPFQGSSPGVPLATLFLQGPSLKLEPSVQHDINLVLEANGCLPDGVPRPNRRGSQDQIGFYRFIAKASTSGEFAVVAQTRVRYWPFDQKHVQGINADIARCAAYTQSSQRLLQPPSVPA